MTIYTQEYWLKELNTIASSAIVNADTSEQQVICAAKVQKYLYLAELAKQGRKKLIDKLIS